MPIYKIILYFILDCHTIQLNYFKEQLCIKFYSCQYEINCNFVSSHKVVGGENSGLIGLKNGRRRWGQTNMKASDSWDESDFSETAVSLSKKPSKDPEEEKPALQYDHFNFRALQQSH